MASEQRHAVGTFSDSEERRARTQQAARPASPERTLLSTPPQSWLCSICRDTVVHQPVLTSCGHGFCRGCLAKALRPPGPPTRARCPICRSDLSAADAVRPNEALQAELARHALPCTNTGCTVSAVCARDWRAHQEACAFTEVNCKHQTHGCTWRGARGQLSVHLEGCPFHALRSYLNKTNQQIHHLRHLALHFETALAQAGQQLTALRQWRNGNMLHYAEFLWALFVEPQAYDANLTRWRSSLDVVFLETLLVCAPLLAAHHGLLTGALSAAPICRAFNAQPWTWLGSPAAEEVCLRRVFRAPRVDVYGAMHALAFALMCAAVLLDGWASPRGWRLWWTHGAVAAYAAAVAPALLADTRLLCAVLLVYTLQCALESITGHSRFLHATQRGALLSACWTSRCGSLRAAALLEVWWCSAAVEARVVAARRTLGRPLRSFADVAQLLRAAAAMLSHADVSKAAAAAAALAAACAAAGELAAMLRWLCNLLLFLLGASFGVRYTAASLLQLALDTRGKNALATAGCRLLFSAASFSGLYILRRCILS